MFFYKRMIEKVFNLLENVYMANPIQLFYNYSALSFMT